VTTRLSFAGALLFTLANTVFTTSYAFAGETGGKGDEIGREKQWAEMLGCSIRHVPSCKALLQASQKSSDQPIRELAMALLEEWDLPATDSRLQRPRLIWAPMPSMDEVNSLLPKVVHWSIIVASGTVQPNGRIANPTILRKSAYETLNKRILNTFSLALYRPARAGDAFVPQKVEFAFKLEPRSAEQR
jgi:hypothetical protein